MLTAAHAMQADVESVSPKLGLVELDRKFLMLGVGGFPVVDQGKLVGIVSRSDIVRMLAVEQVTEEQLSDFYRSFDGAARPAGGPDERSVVGSRVGERMARLTVGDAMIRRVISVERDAPISEIARLLLDGHIHRLPVVDDGRLVGLVTTLDLVRLLADGRIVPAQPDETATALAPTAGRAPGGGDDERRASLERRLERLVARTRAIEDDLRQKRDPDSEERAVERENDEVLERLQESERRHIAQIRRALERIEAGKHDSCERCGQPVGRARQAAMPEATRCLACT